MTVNDFLRKFRKVEHGMNVTRPRVLCADGFTVSVQAGHGLYSTPNCDADAYTQVELGFPSTKDEALMKYAQNRKQPTETIYGSVPVELVDKVLEAHGGITGADFSNDRAGKWRGMEERTVDERRTPPCFGSYNEQINVCSKYCPYGVECASCTDANNDWKE